MSNSSSNDSQVDKKAKLKSSWLTILLGVICFALIPGLFFYLSINVFGKMHYPKSLTIDQQGNVYVVDAGIPGVRKFNPQGDNLLTIGSEGTADGQFKTIYSPDSAATDTNGYIYVLDDHTTQIQKFDSQGKFVQKWAVPANIKQILTGGPNELYLISSKEPFLQKSDSHGQIDPSWSVKLGSPEKTINAVTSTRQGEIYIRIDNTVSKLAKNGVVLTSVTLENPKTEYWRNLEIDSQGNFLLGSDSVIQKFNPQGKLLSSWQTTSTDSSWVRSIVVDKQDNLYTVRSENGRVLIQKFDSSGKALKDWSYGWPVGSNFVFQFVYFITMLLAGWYFRRWNAKPQEVIAGLPLPASVERYSNTPHLLRDSLDLKKLTGNSGLRVKKSTPADILQVLFVLCLMLGFPLVLYTSFNLIDNRSPNWWWVGLGVLAFVPLIWGIVVFWRKEKQRTIAAKAELQTLVGQVMGTLPEANRNLFINTEATIDKPNNSVIPALVMYSVLAYGFLILTTGNLLRTWTGGLLHFAISSSPVILLLGLLWLNNRLRPAKPHIIKLGSAEFGSLARQSGSWLVWYVLLGIGYITLNFLAGNTSTVSFISVIPLLLMVVSSGYLLVGVAVVPHKWFYEALNAGDYEQALRRASYLRSILNCESTRQWQFIALWQAGRFTEAEYLVQEALAKITEPLVQTLQLATVLNRLSLIRIDQERYAEAMFLLEKAINCNPTAVYLANLAEVYLLANANPYRALELLDEAEKFKDNSLSIKILNSYIWANNQINRAWALERIGQSAQAEAAIARVFQKAPKKYQPGLASLHNRAAKIMLLRGDTGRATEHLVQAELLDPQGFTGEQAARNRQLLHLNKLSQY